MHLDLLVLKITMKEVMIKMDNNLPERPQSSISIISQFAEFVKQRKKSVNNLIRIREQIRKDNRKRGIYQ